MSTALIAFPPPTDDEFRLFQALVFRHAGIHLGPEKKALLQARLSRRLRELALPTFGAYFRHATRGPDARQETQRLIDLITTNETSFFREPRQFDYLRERILPAWRQAQQSGQRPARVTVWSAGCSTGEEPFSIAMLLLAELGDEWRVDVLGTDISTRVLQSAQQATWTMERAVQIPDAYRRRFLLRGTGASTGLVRAAPELRAAVRFEHRNLLEPPLQQGNFDLIFCRNVIIYFAPATKQRVVRGLLEQLGPHGLLFLGHAETLADASDHSRCVGPNIYARRADA